MRRYGDARLFRIPSFRKRMRFCYCFKCGGYQNTKYNDKLKKCSCDPIHRYYAPSQWLEYCKNNNLDYKTGKKRKSP